MYLNDYSLNSCEKALFPLHSAYAGRHWKKGTLGHRCIACIEAMPLLGALASLIERAFAKRSKKQAPTAATPPPKTVPPVTVKKPATPTLSLPLRIENSPLDKLWDKSKERHREAQFLLESVEKIKKFEKAVNSGASDGMLSAWHLEWNVLLELPENPRVYIDPYNVSPNNPEDVEVSKKRQETCFREGRDLYITALSANGHMRLYVKERGGQSFCIDSMTGFSTQDVERAFGPCTSIKTGIQKGGWLCTWFTTLFAYQIAKETDVNAYKKVLGAFQDGLLKTFSDLPKIDGARKLESCSRSSSDYGPFFISWGRHALQCQERSWEDISIKKTLQYLDLPGIKEDTFPHICQIEMGKSYKGVDLWEDYGKKGGKLILPRGDEEKTVDEYLQEGTITEIDPNEASTLGELAKKYPGPISIVYDGEKPRFLRGTFWEDVPHS